MLTTLRIKNLALVTDLVWELQPGYNVITGETGAGKSILIGALNLVLGSRADRGLIRSGAESCSVEAVFDVSALGACLTRFLDDNGIEPCDAGQLLIKRSFTAAGANRQFINGSPATLAALDTLGEWLVDIHGPHDHQSLLHPARQLAILDAFGGLLPARDAFAVLVRRRMTLEAEKSALIVDEKTYAQQLDLLRFQTREISDAHLLPDEEKSVGEEFQRAANAAKILELSRAATDALSEGENSLLVQAGAIGRVLRELQRLDPGAAALVESHFQAVTLLREFQAALSGYADKIEVDPARLTRLEERLNLIHSLTRKYGPAIADVLAFAAGAKTRLQSLETRDAELARIHSQLKALDADIFRAGKKLSEARARLVPQLAGAVSRQLEDLGFKKSRFSAALRTSLPDALAPASAPAPGFSGFDRIEFQFEPNPGEPPKPLRAIASSGEMARVMLALKTALAAEDDVPVLVFDEVDANIGGEIANAVGQKMKEIAARRQVLCITHLPQVAAPAGAHYAVTKQVKNGRTVSEVVRLHGKERVSELARMLGGQSAAARQHAEALLK
ncbi:MAG: DNA repair protein RecN [Verrucomicrobia bacterium]|nr:DNA repair protein RecN [Verrucomicrobiota bacterium]MDE3098678.1 DNA repair protein RecN [Verrucomicrobiota bacterium]